MYCCFVAKARTTGTRLLSSCALKPKVQKNCGCEFCCIENVITNMTLIKSTGSHSHPMHRQASLKGVTIATKPEMSRALSYSCLTAKEGTTPIWLKCNA